MFFSLVRTEGIAGRHRAGDGRWRQGESEKEKIGSRQRGSLTDVRKQRAFVDWVPESKSQCNREQRAGFYSNSGHVAYPVSHRLKSEIGRRV